MSDVVSPLLEWLHANPEWAGLATFAISASESVAIIGTIVPGSITMTAIGALVGVGVIPLWSTLIYAILGAIIGDGISYWMGYYFKGGLRRMWPFKNNPGVLKKGEEFVHKYGAMSVFIGRFVGPVRALVPLVAGMLGMRPLQFTIANVASAIGWAPVYMLPGIMLGAAALELPPDIAMHVILVLFLIFLFIVLCIWILYKLFQFTHTQVNNLLNTIWASLKKSKYFSHITVILKHHKLSKTHGQFVLALLCVVALITFVLLAFYVSIVGAYHIAINDIVYHLFRGISMRGNGFDALAIGFTMLGQKQVLLPLVAVLFIWFTFSGRLRLALHILVLAILTFGGVFVLKHLIRSVRPWGISNPIETFSMPSGHATLSATLYMGLALLLIQATRTNKHRLIYTLTFLLIATIGISRLYLGAHWFTDILSGWLLAIVLLSVVIISYQRQFEKSVNPFSLLLLSSCTLLVSLFFYQHRHFEQLEQNYAQIEAPIKQINQSEWWQKNNLLPSYYTSLFGFRSHPINIQWVGDLDEIHSTLLEEGWTRPPVRDFGSTLHRIADVSSTEYLPLVSPQYLDRKPALILTRFSAKEKSLLVLRLWDSYRVVNKDQDPLWVGVLGMVPRSYSWLFRKQEGTLDVSPDILFPNQKTKRKWNWKMMVIEPSPHGKNSQKVILIRHIHD